MADRAETRGKRSRGCLILLGSFVAIGAFGALIGNLNAPAQESKLDRAERIRADGDLATLARGKKAIEAMLKDPSSAEFSDGFGRVKHGQRVACGYVNAQNSFGAMAGREPWLANLDKGVAMVRSSDSQRSFARTWNKYCTDLDDRDRPMRGEFAGIALGSRPPPSLVASPGGDGVLIYRSDKPATYFGVPIDNVWFEIDGGRITAIAVTARGTQSYEAMRDYVRRSYGLPTDVSSAEPPILSWEWTERDPRAQLSFNPKTEQALLTIRSQPPTR